MCKSICRNMSMLIFCPKNMTNRNPEKYFEK